VLKLQLLRVLPGFVIFREKTLFSDIFRECMLLLCQTYIIIVIFFSLRYVSCSVIYLNCSNFIFYQYDPVASVHYTNYIYLCTKHNTKFSYDLILFDSPSEYFNIVHWVRISTTFEHIFIIFGMTAIIEYTNKKVWKTYTIFYLKHIVSNTKNNNEKTLLIPIK
jgi:hypothetical protein